MNKLPFLETIVGVILSDLQGFPKEYFTTGNDKDMDWIRAVYYTLGLQSFLKSALCLNEFQHAIVHDSLYCVLIVRYYSFYISLLIKGENSYDISKVILSKIKQWDFSLLYADSHFRRCSSSNLSLL